MSLYINNVKIDAHLYFITKLNIKYWNHCLKLLVPLFDKNLT